ncbi:MAG: basic rane protein [Abditibacteriota bacterium]|nr:basic rane protein [Abditibacteriota bacterium]
MVLGGCGSNAPQNTAQAPGQSTSNGAEAPSTQSQLKVALLTPGDINDQGWNQLAYEGLKAVEQKLGANISHQVTKNAADQQPALRDFGDSGYDLVLCHGFEFGERVKAIAGKYPKTKFVVVAGNVTQEPNVATIIPKLEDATYLLGMTAGGMTKSNVAGLIGGGKFPVVTSTFEAFEAGAKAVNPKIKILTNYVGNFEDQNTAKEMSKAMLAQKADFLLHNADQAGKGMFVAAQEAGDVWVFGSNRDQNGVAPEVCLASAVINMPQAFVEVAQDVQNGKWKAEFRELNLANGDILVTWNPKLKARVPAALMQKIEAASAQIKSGQLKIKRNV